ncbi:MAG: MerR family transcriptional regulator [Planctomycetaceae bacterium]
MEYRVSELAEAAGIEVDTVRFYQARGLIPAPERRGRFAIYTDDHLERIRRIRSLLDSGFSLAQIGKLLDHDADDSASSTAKGDSTDKSLLAALAAQTVGVGTVSRSELAAESGVPEALIAAAAQAGLIAPIEIQGEERFPSTDFNAGKAPPPQTITNLKPPSCNCLRGFWKTSFRLGCDCWTH